MDSKLICLYIYYIVGPNAIACCQALYVIVCLHARLSQSLLTKRNNRPICAINWQIYRPI